MENALSITAMLMVFGLQTKSQCETIIPSNKIPFMLIDCHNHLGVDLFFYCNGYSPYAQDLPALVTEGRHCGVDRWIVFPMVANLTFDVAEMRQGEIGRRGAREGSLRLRKRADVARNLPALSRSRLPHAALHYPRPAAGAGRPDHQAARAVQAIPVLWREVPGDHEPVRRGRPAPGRTLFPGNGLGIDSPLPHSLQRGEGRHLVASHHDSQGRGSLTDPRRALLPGPFLPLRPGVSRPGCRAAQHVVRLLGAPDPLRRGHARPGLCGAGRARRFPADYRDPAAALQLASPRPTRPS